jgi:hypothetical protein
MTLELSPLLQRTIALAMLGAALLVLTLLVILPLWRSWSLHADQVSMLKRQAHTMESLIEALPRFESAMRSLNAGADARALTFVAPQPALADAQLQSQLRQIVTTASATPTSSQAVAASREGGLTKIAVQMTVIADLGALAQVLHQIESSRPLLRIEKLAVGDPDGEWAATAQPVANKLQTELTVSAFVRAP